MWFYQIIRKDWDKIAKTALIMGGDLVKELYNRLSGLGISKTQILKTLEETNLAGKKPTNWTQEDLRNFAFNLRHFSKPMIIAANKSDLDVSKDNIKRLMEELKGKYIIIPVSAESELALRKAANAGLIDYLPGDSDFKIIGEPTEKQLKALEYIRENVLKIWGSTGVQESINRLIFDVLSYVAVYPVENEIKYTDHDGNVLPDVYLMPAGSNVRDLAFAIHTDLGEKFAFAIDARTGKRLSADTILEHRSIIKIVTTR